MEDISQKISDLLGSPDGMDRLKSVAGELLGNGLFKDQENSQKPPENGGFSLPANIMENMGNIEGIMKIARLFGKEQKDSRIELLRALKPHLSDERSKRVDKAISILKIATLIPVLREEGLLDSLGF